MITKLNIINPILKMVNGWISKIVIYIYKFYFYILISILKFNIIVKL